MAVLPVKVKPNREAEPVKAAPKKEEREPFMVLVKDRKTGEKTLRAPTKDEKEFHLEEEIKSLDGKVHAGKMVAWATGIGAAASFVASFAIPGFFIVFGILVVATVANYFTRKANEKDLQMAWVKLDALQKGGKTAQA